MRSMHDGRRVGGGTVRWEAEGAARKASRRRWISLLSLGRASVSASKSTSSIGERLSNAASRASRR